MVETAKEISLYLLKTKDDSRIFSVMVGYDVTDPHSIDHDFGNFLPRLHDGIDGLSIGFNKSKGIVHLVSHSCNKLTQGGHLHGLESDRGQPAPRLAVHDHAGVVS